MSNDRKHYSLVFKDSTCVCVFGARIHFENDNIWIYDDKDLIIVGLVCVRRTDLDRVDRVTTDTQGIQTLKVLWSRMDYDFMNGVTEDFPQVDLKEDK